MPWNSGTFSRIYGASGWTDDKNSGTKILSSRHDTHDQDIADGVNSCMTRDNQAKPTASFLPATDNTLGLGSLGVRWATLNGISISDFARLSIANTFTAATLTLQNSANPKHVLDDTDAGANQRRWSIRNANGTFTITTETDAAVETTNAISIARTGTTVDSINLSATAVQVNGNDLTVATGSFTATLSGMTGATTGTLNYKKMGNTVVLYNNSGSDINGTSNTSAMTISGIPAAINPSAQRVVCAAFINSGSYVSGFAQLSSSNTIAASIPGNFTASGGKGLPGGWCIVYQL